MSRSALTELTNPSVRGRLTRRDFVKRGIGLGLSLPTLAAASRRRSVAHAAPAELNVIGWGGQYGDAIDKWVNKPFEAATRVKVVMQYQAVASQSLAKLHAEKARPSVDVWLTADALALQLAKTGAVEELTLEKVPNLQYIAPKFVQKYQGKTYAAAIHVSPFTIMVDNTRIKSLMPDYK